MAEETNGKHETLVLCTSKTSNCLENVAKKGQIVNWANSHLQILISMENWMFYFLCVSTDLLAPIPPFGLRKLKTCGNQKNRPILYSSRWLLMWVVSYNNKIGESLIISKLRYLHKISYNVGSFENIEIVSMVSMFNKLTKS